MMKRLFVFPLLVILSGSLFALTGFADSTVNVTLDETISDTPLPVELSSFTATTTANLFVKLQWVSETESNMLGYNVWRGSEGELSEATKITFSIIPAYNNSFTTNYSYLDEEVTPGDVYYYWLQGVSLDLTSEYFGPLSVTVEEPEEEVPLIFTTTLRKNFPNPFNPDTTIEYSIREETETVLRIYNLRGQVVKTLFSGIKEAGEYRAIWNGTDSSGREVSSGIYFYRLTTDHYDSINKMLLVK